jgi:hypothetical protein
MRQARNAIKMTTPFNICNRVLKYIQDVHERSTQFKQDKHDAMGMRKLAYESTNKVHRREQQVNEHSRPMRIKKPQTNGNIPNEISNNKSNEIVRFLD